MSHHRGGFDNTLGIGNSFLGLAPFLLLPFLFTNNRRNVNIININTRRRRPDDFC
ncbi:hypothetical protein [Candidatus Clostridium stratigraminis]|uniref:Uncharacterized protein n=1 Tax=Candidatus Clostridium stratigraminis TaxID=3381661 RepID=A0ABW8T8C1_9CLOT